MERPASREKGVADASKVKDVTDVVQDYLDELNNSGITDCAVAAEDAVAAKPKRGRGRPRKQQ